jgi:hypothetical protein
MQLLHWLVHYGVPLTLEQVRSLQTVSRVQDSSLVCTLLRWLTVMLRQFPTDIEDPKARQAALESRFVFALVWALGGAVNTANRRVMDKFFKKLCSGDLQPDPKQKRRLQVPDRGSIFEYNFTTQNRSEGEVLIICIVNSGFNGQVSWTSRNNSRRGYSPRRSLYRLSIRCGTLGCSR